MATPIGTLEWASIQQSAGHWLTMLADVSLKGLVILGAAGAVTLAMRKASATARHLVWLLAMASLMALPLLSVALPSWGVLPQWIDLESKLALTQGEAEPAQAMPEAPAGGTISPLITPEAAQDPPIAGEVAPQEVAVPTETPDPTALAADEAATKDPKAGLSAASILPWVMPVWAVGVVICLTPLVLGRLSLWRLKRSARPIKAGPLAELLARISGQLHLRRPVALLASDRRPMPMIWGIFRSKLLLPAEADEWSPQRQRVVLLHELAHAARWDCLAKLVAHVACALYWFNPLAWLAFRCLQREAEAACDDLVLAAGAKPSGYAKHILEIASGLQTHLLAAHSSIAMARKSKLEGRLLGILDGRRNRRKLTRIAVVIAAILVASVVVPLSMLYGVGPESADAGATSRRQALLAAAADTPKDRKALLESLAQNARSLDACYDLLIKHMLDGQFEAVRTALTLRDGAGNKVFADYRFAELAARNAGAIFWDYDYHTAPLGWANDKQATRFRQLARACTTAYEEAFRLAASGYEKACLYARWHEFHTRRRFEADSRLLRSGSPLTIPQADDEPRLSKQAQAMKAAVAAALKHVQTKDGLTAEQKQRFADVFAEEYRSLARMGVPEDVFQELLRDVAGFLHTAIHEAVLKDAQKERMTLTLRFFIWHAITASRPGPVERKRIEQQVKAISKKMREKFDQQIPAHDLLPDGVHTAQRFEQAWLSYRDNRFAPWFKRAVLSFVWSEPAHKYDKKTLDNLDERFQEWANMLRGNLADWDKSLPKRPPEILARMAAEMRQSTKRHLPNLVLSQAIRFLAKYDRPMLYQQPPGVRLSSSGSGAPHGVPLHRMGKYVEVPPFPWTKRISAGDHCRWKAGTRARDFLDAVRANNADGAKSMVWEKLPQWSLRRAQSLVGELRQQYGESLATMTTIRKVVLTNPWSWAAVLVADAQGKAQPLVVVFRWASRQKGHAVCAAGPWPGAQTEAALRDYLTQQVKALTAPQPPVRQDSPQAARDASPQGWLAARREEFLKAWPIDSGWGDPVNTYRCRLLAQRRRWAKGETPLFIIEAEGAGNVNFGLEPSQEAHCRVELDGQWYNYAGEPMKPVGGVHFAVPVSLSAKWKGDEGLLQLGLGKHTVRVAFPFPPSPSERTAWLISKPLEIEVVDGPATQPALGREIEVAVTYTEGFPSKAVPVSGNMYLDLDTGRHQEFRTLPDSKMVRKAGVDIYYGREADGSGPRLDTSNLQVQPIGWKSDLETVRHSLAAASPYALLPSETRPLAFRTREGGIGILQIVAVTAKPAGIRIRYKLLAQAPATQPGEEPQADITVLSASVAHHTYKWRLDRKMPARMVYGILEGLDGPNPKRLLQAREGTGGKGIADYTLQLRREGQKLRLEVKDQWVPGGKGACWDFMTWPRGTELVSTWLNDAAKLTGTRYLVLWQGDFVLRDKLVKRIALIARLATQDDPVVHILGEGDSVKDIQPLPQTRPGTQPAE